MENVSKSKHLLLQWKVYLNWIFFFFGLVIWHCKSAFQIHTQTRFCGNRATNRSSGYWFFFGGYHLVSAKPWRAYANFHVYFIFFLLPPPHPYPWEFNIKQAHLLFIKRLVDLLIKQRESDLCCLLKSPYCGLLYGPCHSVFWEPHPGLGSSSTFGWALVLSVSKMFFLMLPVFPSLSEVCSHSYAFI